MKLKVVASRQSSPPLVVYDHRGPELRGLHNGLSLAAILPALPVPFREEEIDGAVFIAVAALEKCVVITGIADGSLSIDA